MNRESILADYEPQWLGTYLECHESLPSTSDRARELLSERGSGAHGAVVVAEAQSAGRGRRDRSWHTSPGRSAALSLVYCPSRLDYPGLLGPAAGLSGVRALASHCGLHCRLKWPNDVLASGKKIAGILLEGRWRGEVPDGFVLGIGVNLLQQAGDFPPEIRSFATSALMETGRAVAPARFIAALLGCLQDDLPLAAEDPAGLRESLAGIWIHRRGDPLVLVLEREKVAGTFAGIGLHGELLLSDGTTQTHYPCGEIPW